MNAKRSTSVFAQKGETVTVEVTHKNEERRFLIVETDSGQTTVIPESQLAGNDRFARAARFDALRARNGDSDGSEFQVLVTDAYRGGRDMSWKITVSERALTTGIEDDEDGMAPSANVLPPEVLENARRLKDAGTVVKGTIKGNAPDGGKVVELNGFRGVLPRDHFFTKNASSLASGQKVRVKVLDVTDREVVLTRRNIA